MLNSMASPTALVSHQDSTLEHPGRKCKRILVGRRRIFTTEAQRAQRRQNRRVGRGTRPTTPRWVSYLDPPYAVPLWFIPLILKPSALEGVSPSSPATSWPSATWRSCPTPPTPCR